jgi:hypothetical protein
LRFQVERVEVSTLSPDEAFRAYEARGSAFNGLPGETTHFISKARR